MSTYPFESFPAASYILFFIILWICVCKLLSAIGGWRSLAGDYQAHASFDGQKLWFKSVTLRRWTNYNNCVNMGADKYGLFLSVFLIFRIGHPPLYIPWTDISTEAVSRRFLPDIVKLTFAKQPEVPAMISQKLAARIIKMRQDGRPRAGV